MSHHSLVLLSKDEKEINVTELTNDSVGYLVQHLTAYLIVLLILKKLNIKTSSGWYDTLRTVLLFVFSFEILQIWGSESA